MILLSKSQQSTSKLCSNNQRALLNVNRKNWSMQKGGESFCVYMTKAYIWMWHYFWEHHNQPASLLILLFSISQFNLHRSPENSTFDSQMLLQCSRMEHGGNIKTCNCIAHFYIPAFHCTVIIMQHKMRTTTVRIASTMPKSKDLTQHHGSHDSGAAPPLHLHVIKTRCRDPPIAQQPLPLTLKNTHFHLNSWSA